MERELDKDFFIAAVKAHMDLLESADDTHHEEAFMALLYTAYHCVNFMVAHGKGGGWRDLNNVLVHVIAHAPIFKQLKGEVLVSEVGTWPPKAK